MGWSVETLSHTVDRELEELPADIRANLNRIVALIESFGLENVGYPYVKHVTGPLWEMRPRGKDGIARALYVTACGKKVVVVRVFLKKTQKIPRREIELAMQRAKGLVR